MSSKDWTVRGAAGLAAVVLAGGCGGASASEVKREFAAVVEASNDCAEASDCALVVGECPLPCYSAVNRESEARVRRRARELVDEYESGGEACDYECVAPPTVECVSSRCEVSFDDPEG